ncbi:MAG: hypothetical protein ABIZ95_22205, partial [Pyrinomonadaceae bacterium]
MANRINGPFFNLTAAQFIYPPKDMVSLFGYHAIGSTSSEMFPVRNISLLRNLVDRHQLIAESKCLFFHS